MVTPRHITAWAMALGEVVKQPHFEKMSFRSKKRIFATLDEKKQILVVKLGEIDQSVFCQYDDQIIKPVDGAWGKQGWTMLNLKKVRKTICRDALTTAYETVSKK